MLPQVITGCVKGSNFELQKLHDLLGFFFPMYFGHSRGVDECPGILQSTQKDS